MLSALIEEIESVSEYGLLGIPAHLNVKIAAETNTLLDQGTKRVRPAESCCEPGQARKSNVMFSYLIPHHPNGLLVLGS